MVDHSLAGASFGILSPFATAALRNGDTLGMLRNALRDAAKPSRPKRRAA